MNIAHKIAVALILIGALNWLLVGFLRFNIVDAIFKEKSLASRIIYSLVGLAGVFYIVCWIMTHCAK